MCVSATDRSANALAFTSSAISAKNGVSPMGTADSDRRTCVFGGCERMSELCAIGRAVVAVTTRITEIRTSCGQ